MLLDLTDYQSTVVRILPEPMFTQIYGAIWHICLQWVNSSVSSPQVKPDQTGAEPGWLGGHIGDNEGWFPEAYVEYIGGEEETTPASFTPTQAVTSPTTEWVLRISETRREIEDKVDDLVHDCSNSIANTMELLQSCTKPSKSSWFIVGIPMSQSYLVPEYQKYIWLVVVEPLWPNFS